MEMRQGSRGPWCVRAEGPWAWRVLGRGEEAGRAWTAGKAVAWPVQTILQRKQQVTRRWEARRGVSGDEVLC